MPGHSVRSVLKRGIGCNFPPWYKFVLTHFCTENCRLQAKRKPLLIRCSSAQTQKLQVQRELVQKKRFFFDNQLPTYSLPLSTRGWRAGRQGAREGGRECGRRALEGGRRALRRADGRRCTRAASLTGLRTCSGLWTCSRPWQQTMYRSWLLERKPLEGCPPTV